jgi:hypothetical protein
MNRVKILNGIHKGKFATVLSREVPNKVLVYLDGAIAHEGLRAYATTSVETVSPTPPPVEVPPPLPPSEFKYNTLVFEDNFDNVLDTTKWSRYFGAGHAGNGLRHPSAWSIEEAEGASGKALVCTARWVDGPTALSMAPSWFSTTQKDKIRNGAVIAGGMSHFLDFMYGRVEVRSRVEGDPLGVTQCYFPLSWPGSNNWPAEGEVNIFETTGSNPDGRSPMKAYAHYSAQNLQKYFSYEGVSGLDWHTVMYEWAPDYLKFWVDGILRWTMTDPIAIPRWLHHICLQLDAMKNVPMAAPVRGFVDYVRIWR